MDLAIDVLAMAGLLLVGVGLWLWWPPVAFIVVGAILFGVGLFGAAIRAGWLLPGGGRERRRGK